MTPLVKSESEIKISRKVLRRLFWGIVILLVLVGIVCAAFEVGVDKQTNQRPTTTAQPGRK